MTYRSAIFSALVAAFCCGSSVAQLQVDPLVDKQAKACLAPNHCAAPVVSSTGLILIQAQKPPYTTTIGCKTGTRVNCSTAWKCCDKGGSCDSDGFPQCK